jgi:hypothetical protein
MTFHYAKYDRNPINDWFPAKRQTFKWVYLKTMKTAMVVNRRLVKRIFFTCMEFIQFKLLCFNLIL